MDDFPSVPREGGLDRCWNTLLAGQRPAVCHSLWSMETAPPPSPQQSFLLSTCPYLESVPGSGELTLSKSCL